MKLVHFFSMWASLLTHKKKKKSMIWDYRFNPSCKPAPSKPYVTNHKGALSVHISPSLETNSKCSS